jgi:phosphate:Na+ symporter
MVTSFTVAGLIALAPALAVMLGANVGTTLITQILSFNIGPFGPPLVLLGVLTFRWSEGGRIKNLGRIAIGLGLMLMALTGLVRTLTPVENAPALRAIMSALTGEPVLALLVAVAVTWACHSSIAVILLIVSFASTGVVDTTTSLALVLGANLGGTLPPLVEAGSRTARRLPLGNALIRLVGCMAALPFLPLLGRNLARIDPSPARLVVNFHTAFNLGLACVFIGLTAPMAQLLIRLLPNPPTPSDPGKPVYLEPDAIDAPTVAVAAACRETLRMADMIEAMLRGALEVFRHGDRKRAREITRMDRTVDRLGTAIRSYLSDIGRDQPLDVKGDGARSLEILSAVINLEHVGDIIANGLMEFALRNIEGRRTFSNPEMTVITDMHAALLESLRLGISVFLSGNSHDASRLVERKATLRRMEAEATALHIRLLRTTGHDNLGQVAENSGLFLRIVRDLRRVHSHIASLGYAALNRDSQDGSLLLDYEESEVAGDLEKATTDDARQQSN